jgi:hypothetical protein
MVSPNIFCCCPRNSSPFWKGVVWAAKAAKLGFRWHIGNDRKVRFWEDLWVGTCSLAIQYWNVYSIINEQGKTIREAWDGVNLKFTFMRTVSSEIMNQWLEVVQIASCLKYSKEEEAMIWHTTPLKNTLSNPYIPL